MEGRVSVSGPQQGSRAPGAGIVLACLWILAPVADGLAQPAPADSNAVAEEFDLSVESVRVHQRGGSLRVDVELRNLLDEATRDHLERGAPATVLFDIELWRERGMWFDRLQTSVQLVSRFQYDIWDEVYSLESIDPQGRSLEQLDELDEVVARVAYPKDVPVVDIDEIEEEKSYYLVINASLKPFTLDDVDELEEWLSGVGSGGKRGFGILGLPRQLFGVLLSFTGLQDRNETIRTREFERDEVLRSLRLEQL